MPKKKSTSTDDKDIQTVATTPTANDSNEQIGESDNSSIENTCTNSIQEIEAQTIVKNHIMMGITAGFIPLPLVDIAALTTLQLHMLQSLSHHFDIDFEKKSAKPLLTALITGSLPVLGAASLTKMLPMIGTLGGGAALSLVSGSTIYATGQIFVSHFSQGGTLADLNIKQARQVFKKEYEQGKVFVKELIKKNPVKEDEKLVENAT